MQHWHHWRGLSPPPAYKYVRCSGWLCFACICVLCPITRRPPTSGWACASHHSFVNFPPLSQSASAVAKSSVPPCICSKRSSLLAETARPLDQISVVQTRLAPSSATQPMHLEVLLGKIPKLPSRGSLLPVCFGKPIHLYCYSPAQYSVISSLMSLNYILQFYSPTHSTVVTSCCHPCFCAICSPWINLQRARSFCF